jgi:hypothetical protein
LRDARWLTLKRLNAYATVMIVVTAAIITWALTGPGVDDPAGRAVGTDFVSFWTVSWAVLNGRQDTIYVPAALAGLEQAVVPHGDAAFYPWLYPPTALLIVYPLALLPYLWALGAWLVAGLAGYLTALWRILPFPQTLWAGLGFPAVLVTATHGQNAFLVTALLAWGLLLLRRQPIIAGILVGMLSFKPQLGVLLPVAMISGGHGRAVAAAALTVFTLSAATILLFGPNAWHEFVANTSFTYTMLNAGLVPYFKFQSVFAAIRLLGGGPVIAYITQAVAAAGAAGLVAWIWRNPSDPDIKSASVLAATPLATPYLVDYDLVLLAPAIAWMVRSRIRYGALPWEGVTFAAVTLLTLVARPVAECTHILFTPAAAAGLLAVIVARSISKPGTRCGQPTPYPKRFGAAGNEEST